MLSLDKLKVSDIVNIRVHLIGQYYNIQDNGSKKNKIFTRLQENFFYFLLTRDRTFGREMLFLN